MEDAPKRVLGGDEGLVVIVEASQADRDYIVALFEGSDEEE